MAATAAEGGRHAQAEERTRVPTEGEPDGVGRLAHTADTAIAVTAPTFDLCLARAAAGMFGGFLRPTSEATSTVRTDVELEADSRTELLVRWLEEMLYRSDANGLAFGATMGGR
jgi:SHS2 domain-containing protein